jgi:hypothetical protein
MLKILHLRDAYKLKFKDRVAVDEWEFPDGRLFWANKFNIFQVEQGISTLPFAFAICGDHPNGLDVLIVKLGESVIINHALILAGKALIKFLNLL